MYIKLGIQLVTHSEDFYQQFMAVQLSSKKYFGNSDLYLEKYLENIRHVEVQVIRDTFGNCIIPGIRDCTIQRNKQKIIEESSSSLLSKTIENDLYSYTQKLIESVNYVGVGTVEFIYDIDRKSIYFIEMNTRLQVEHPVTELSAQIDIVSAQIKIAMGESIKEITYLPLSKQPYSIEVRINAEYMMLDEENTPFFMPDPGKIIKCIFPKNPNITIISFIENDSQITPYYDNLVAQIIVSAKNRTEAINTLNDYLASIQIIGISTNIPLLQLVLTDSTFQKGNYTTQYLDYFLKQIDSKLLLRDSALLGSNALFKKQQIEVYGTKELKVLSPSTGICYLTPSPIDPEYISLSQVITIKDVLCQIEAMKVFTMIQLSTYNQGDYLLYDPNIQFKIIRINVMNTQQINKGDLLFVIEPIIE